MGRIIIIEGLIGCGKTTFGKTLEKLCIDNGYKCHFFSEQFNSDLLQLYLSDKKKYAFSFQSIMAMERKRILNEACEMSKNGYIVIVDRGLLGDYSFARMLFQNGIINNDEWSTYHSLVFNSIDINDRYLPCEFFDRIEDCQVVYLQCSPEIAFERMTKRNRIGEKEGYNLEYFINLQNCYLQTLQELYPNTIYIDWSKSLDINIKIIKDVGLSKGIVIN